MPYLQSKNAVFDAEEDWQKVDNECDHYWDFLFRVTVAPDSGSQDPFWLIRIKVNNCIAYSEGLDSYGNKIDAGQWYLKGHFLETMNSDKGLKKVFKSILFINF